MCVIICHPRHPVAPLDAFSVCTSLLLRYSSVHKLQSERNSFSFKINSFNNHHSSVQKLIPAAATSKPPADYPNVPRLRSTETLSLKQWFLSIVTCILIRHTKCAQLAFPCTAAHQRKVCCHCASPSFSC